MNRIWFVVALLAGATVALAGSYAPQYVSIWRDTAGLLNANGALESARHSADIVQYIGCSIDVYPRQSVSAVCYARDASGQYLSCNTGDRDVLTLIRNLNPASYLSFAVDSNGECASVHVVHASFGLD